MSSAKCKIGVNLKLVFLILAVILYIIFGGLAFAALELKSETLEVNRMRKLKQVFEAKVFSCNITEKEIETFLGEVILASQSGVLVTNNVTYSASWSFSQSVFFAGTLITTIGYGHTLPLSPGGKVFAIFYTAFGIPLVLVMFSVIVHRLMHPLGKLLHLLKDKMLGATSETVVELLHLGLISLIVFTLFFLLPAAIFSKLEKDWTYLDSFYYVYISLTTIGLGDYIPGEKYGQAYKEIYKIGVTVYLVVGLVCIMTCLALVYNIKVLHLTNYFVMDDSKADDTEHLLSSRTNSTMSLNYTAEKTDDSETKVPKPM